MDILPFYVEFGEPIIQVTRGGGTLAVWFRNPVTLTRLEGYIIFSADDAFELRAGEVLQRYFGPEFNKGKDTRAAC